MSSVPRERILVVDDESGIRDLVASYLRNEGFDVAEAVDGEDALTQFGRHPHDLVVLDLRLPGIGGLDVLREIRRTSHAYVIVLTARAEETDKLIGLELGADDYVTKPFSPRQLVARVEAVLRRAAGESEVQARRLSFADGDLQIDGRTAEVLKRGERVDLTPSELRLLQVLAASPGRVFSRDELIDRALGPDFDGFDRTVDVHVKNLRQKIESDPREPRYVQTVHGLGYRFARE